MAKLSSRAQISQAIGSAKELIEACNRATCDLLEVEYPQSDFPRLGKVVRNELAGLERGSETATKAIDQLVADGDDRSGSSHPSQRSWDWTR